jgi:hypothetical protein
MGEKGETFPAPHAGNKSKDTGCRNSIHKLLLQTTTTLIKIEF